MRRALTVVLAGVIPFTAIVLLMIGMQTQLLFPTHAVPAAGPLPAGVAPMQVATPDGQTLHGVHFPPSALGAEKLLVLGFGGNAWNGQEVANFLHDIFPESHVVAFHYRGYWPSTGMPSAERLMADAPLVLDAARERVQPDRTILAGFSIGSGVAAALASQRRVDGLILVTPFDSLKKVAQDLYPWLPVGPFFAHEMDAAAALAEVQAPVAIIAAAGDEIIPARRTHELRRRIGTLVFDRTIDRAGHNDVYGRTEFRDAMQDSLKALKSK